MMIGGLPNFKEFEEKAKKIGQADESSDIDKLKADLKWMKWAIILLIAYILYKETK
jgi:hypothetical protein